MKDNKRNPFFFSLMMMMMILFLGKDADCDCLRMGCVSQCAGMGLHMREGVKEHDICL